MPIASEIQIPSKLQTDFVAYNQFDEPTGSNRLVGLSKLNVIIGPNNSGKSRLLRELYSDRVLGICGDTGSAVRDAQNRFQELMRTKNLSEGIDKFQRTLVLCHPRLRSIRGDHLPKERQQIPEHNALETLRQRAQEVFSAAFKNEHKEFITLIRDLDRAMRSDMTQPPESQTQILRIYIPTLRGLRPPENDRHYFHNRTVKDYFPEGKPISNGIVKLAEANLLTGLELYNDVQNHLLGTPEERRLMREFERFIGEIFFGGQEITLMPRINTDVLHLKIGDEPELPIYSLGDGLQHILIMTLPLFLHREKPMMLFIEEPELFLHPGFQRILIDAFLNRSGSQHQIFVATHSHQFLDITIDKSQCSIYTCRKQREETTSQTGSRFCVKLAACDDFAILRELGVRNSSVLLSNCTIWVEGVTDRMYYRHFLKLLQDSLPPDQPRFLEDLHFSFVEFSGGNITHWSILDDDNGIRVDRLCGHAFVICDRDSSICKSERHQELSDKLGDRFYVLTCREVENLLTPEVIEAVVKSYEGENCNLNSFQQSDYQGELLGDFIQDRVLPDKQSKRRSKIGRPYADSSGTIKAKVDFCNRSIPQMQRLDQLSPEAVEIASTLYRFIEKQNS